MKRRAFVVVLDACGAGALPDAAAYGDAGANTLGHLAAAVGGLDLPALEYLGLGAILPLAGVTESPVPVLHGRLGALGPGKDTTAGHWELMGVVVDVPPPTYPDGFPPEILAELRSFTGRGVLCNAPYNGIAAIEDFGERHVESGDLILYTSQDSVLQVAAHVDVLAPEALYAACAAMREALGAAHPIGRVIARPFRGEPGAFERTDGRRDYALPPPGRSYLDGARDAGVPVHSVGKVGQVFAGRGIDEQHPGATNVRALAETTALMEELEHGLVFTNLVETDQLYGHRKDVEGFHRALQAVDSAVRGWLELLDPARDLLVLTADHGCDPAATHTDHTREHVPLLASFAGHGGRRHDGALADVGASALRWLTGREDAQLPGESFVP